MALTIEMLHYGSADLDARWLVAARGPGRMANVPVLGYLIMGAADGPILVDTGFRSADMMQIMGMTGHVLEGQGLENELARHGMRPADVRFILHTHLHMDHAGKDDVFPSATTVVVNRREVEVGAGHGTLAYLPQDIKHTIDRIYTPGAAWLLDLGYSGPVEIVPGVVCDLTGGHTEGHMNVLVETADGRACICGDLVYSVQDQIVQPSFELQYREPKTSGNHDVAYAQEKGAIKKALNSARWLLPMHDFPASVDVGGKVSARLKGNTLPGPVEAIKY